MMDDPGARSFAVEKYREFVATVEVRWLLWLDAVRSLSEAEISTPGTCGEWSVKDLIAHVAVWDSVAVEKIRDIVNGTIGELSSDSLETSDEFNQRNAAIHSDTPLDVLTAAMLAAHQTLIEKLCQTSSQSNETLERIEWAAAEDTSKHYAEHESQIRQRFAGKS